MRRLTTTAIMLALTIGLACAASPDSTSWRQRPEPALHTLCTRLIGPLRGAPRGLVVIPCATND
jgi:hypothetical protein